MKGLGALSAGHPRVGKRIVVSLDERGSSSGFATNKKEPGIMTWSVSLPPGTKREVSLSYRVRLPRGLEPGGLD